MGADSGGMSIALSADGKAGYRPQSGNVLKFYFKK
jgi:hypothetical protein